MSVARGTSAGSQASHVESEEMQTDVAPVVEVNVNVTTTTSFPLASASRAPETLTEECHAPLDTNTNGIHVNGVGFTHEAAGPAAPASSSSSHTPPVIKSYSPSQVIVSKRRAPEGSKTIVVAQRGAVSSCLTQAAEKSHSMGSYATSAPPSQISNEKVPERRSTSRRSNSDGLDAHNVDAVANGQRTPKGLVSKSLSTKDDDVSRSTLAAGSQERADAPARTAQPTNVDHSATRRIVVEQQAGEERAEVVASQPSAAPTPVRPSITHDPRARTTGNYVSSTRPRTPTSATGGAAVHFDATQLTRRRTSEGHINVNPTNLSERRPNSAAGDWKSSLSSTRPSASTREVPSAANRNLFSSTFTSNGRHFTALLESHRHHRSPFMLTASGVTPKNSCNVARSYDGGAVTYDMHGQRVVSSAPRTHVDSSGAGVSRTTVGASSHPDRIRAQGVVRRKHTDQRASQTNASRKASIDVSNTSSAPPPSEAHEQGIKPAPSQGSADAPGNDAHDDHHVARTPVSNSLHDRPNAYGNGSAAGRGTTIRGPSSSDARANTSAALSWDKVKTRSDLMMRSTASYAAKTKQRNARLQKKSVNVCLTKYALIRTVAAEQSFEIEESQEELEKTDFNLIWSDTVLPLARLNQLANWQRSNHFPSMYLLCRKGHLGITLGRMRRLLPDHFNFYPRTWSLRSERQQLQMFLTAVKSRRMQKVFILKPNSGCQGKGIVLSKDPLNAVEEPDNYIAQEYLANPLLIEGKKFDLRVYALLTSIRQPSVFLFNDGLVRMCAEEYEKPCEANMKNTCKHLTNYAVNKHSDQFVFNTDASRGDIGNKRNFAFFNKFLVENGKSPEKFWDRVGHLICKAILVVQPQIMHVYNSCFPMGNEGYSCFEILGFDILVDQKMKPWLMEVNHTPSLSTDTPLDFDIKHALISETWNIIDIKASDRRLHKERERELFSRRMQPNYSHTNGSDSQRNAQLGTPKEQRGGGSTSVLTMDDLLCTTGSPGSPLGVNPASDRCPGSTASENSSTVQQRSAQNRSARGSTGGRPHILSAIEERRLREDSKLHRFKRIYPTNNIEYQMLYDAITATAQNLVSPTTISTCTTTNTRFVPSSLMSGPVPQESQQLLQEVDRMRRARQDGAQTQTNGSNTGRAGAGAFTGPSSPVTQSAPSRRTVAVALTGQSMNDTPLNGQAPARPPTASYRNATSSAQLSSQDSHGAVGMDRNTTYTTGKRQTSQMSLEEEYKQVHADMQRVRQFGKEHTTATTTQTNSETHATNDYASQAGSAVLESAPSEDQDELIRYVQRLRTEEEEEPTAESQEPEVLPPPQASEEKESTANKDEAAANKDATPTRRSHTIERRSHSPVAEGAARAHPLSDDRSRNLQTSEERHSKSSSAANSAVKGRGQLENRSPPQGSQPRYNNNNTTNGSFTSNSNSRTTSALAKPHASVSGERVRQRPQFSSAHKKRLTPNNLHGTRTSGDRYSSSFGALDLSALAHSTDGAGRTSADRSPVEYLEELQRCLDEDAENEHPEMDVDIEDEFDEE